MFTALTLSMALGAPIPTPSDPVPVGVAPQVMELKASADGKVVVTVRRTEKVQVNVARPVNPGGAAPAVITRQRLVTRQVELGDVKDLTITTADGKKVTTEDAIKKIGNGAIVVISSDGKPVSPAYLKVFKDDTLVLSSPELAGVRPTAIPRPGGLIRPLPAVPPGGAQILPIQPGKVQILPVQGGAIQIQVAPAIGRAAPPVPVEKAPPPRNDK